MRRIAGSSAHHVVFFTKTLIRSPNELKHFSRGLVSLVLHPPEGNSVERARLCDVLVRNRHLVRVPLDGKLPVSHFDLPRVCIVMQPQDVRRLPPAHHGSRHANPHSHQGPARLPQPAPKMFPAPRLNYFRGPSLKRTGPGGSRRLNFRNPTLSWVSAGQLSPGSEERQAFVKF